MSSMYPPPGGLPARRCARCGIPMPPDVVNCGQCGAYNAIPQPNGPVPPNTNFGPPWGSAQAGQYPPGPSGPWGPPGMPPVQAVPPQYIPTGNNVMPPSQFQRPSQPLTTSGQNFKRPGQFQQPGLDNYGNFPAQNFYAPSSSAVSDNFQSGYMNGTGVADQDEEEDERHGPRIGLILGVIALLIVLVGGGFLGAALVQNRARNNNTTSSSTKTPVITTPTVKPLFSDTFVNNSAGWDLTSAPGKFSVAIGNGRLTLEDDENKLLPEVVPGRSFGDFQLELDAMLTKGDKNSGYGVYIRAGASQDSYLGVYYRFELYGDGTYAIFKGTLDSSGNTQSMKVQGYLTNAAIALEGHPNHITIIARGSTMTFKVNGQTITTYTDDSYKGGSIALFVSNLPQTPPGAQATFSNLAIFPLT
ncbi:MAG TPA: family 16 glycoside hydrolase [Ktedonobacteraceae bacterium]|nr:family 16 glycoside hydrolase [Ktedonobacteraceae bacterium]